MDDLTGDLVIASLVFDVVAVTDKMFRSCLANVTDNALRSGEASYVGRANFFGDSLPYDFPKMWVKTSLG